jgi:DNA-binding NarL/FixJ family response regulator
MTHCAHLIIRKRNYDVQLMSPESLLPAPVLIVEDDSLMQQRLITILESLGYARSAISSAANLAEARQQTKQSPYAIVLVDIGLPDGSGVSLIQELRAEDPSLCILVISAWSTEDIILGALEAGATGYVLKERDDLEVTLSIRSVLRGGAPIDPFIARRILEKLPTASTGETVAKASNAPEALSAREKEILTLISEGMSNREIAEQLVISRYTVECHIKHIYRKLAVSSRTRAINAARQHGLLS